MNRIIPAVMAVLTITLGAFLFSLSLSPNWSVQRRVYINARPGAIMPYIEDINKWKTWNTWVSRRGLRDIKAAPAKENRVNYTIASKEKGMPKSAVIIVVGADTGAYVFLKVQGRTESSPLTRYLMFIHNDYFGKELEEGLQELKKEVEKE